MFSLTQQKNDHGRKEESLHIPPPPPRIVLVKCLIMIPPFIFLEVSANQDGLQSSKEDLIIKQNLLKGVS